MNKVLIYSAHFSSMAIPREKYQEFNPALTDFQLQPQLHILYVYISATILVSLMNSTMQESALSPGASLHETSWRKPYWKLPYY